MSGVESLVAKGELIALRKKGRCLPVVLLSLLVFWANDASSELMRVTENLRKEEVFLPASAPDRTHLVLDTIVRIRMNAEVVGWAAIYDDRETKRPMDYLELYDRAGSLLAVRWVDRFGIVRTAVDQGLLDEDAPEILGILSLLDEGIPA